MALFFLAEEIDRLEKDGLLRNPRVLERYPLPQSTIDGREVLLFCSNDYLGLSNHVLVKQAAIDAIEKYGVGICSSRLISGTHQLHRKLEHRLSQWLGYEKSLLFTSGFAANIAVLTSLATQDDVIFSDALNHASIVEGCRLSKARTVVYPHNDVETLERLIKDSRKARRKYIISDSLFSVDGDFANIGTLFEISKKFTASLIIDEAHSLGLIGPHGKGLCAKHGIYPDVLIGTFGKAFGTIGAFVSGSVSLIQLLQSRAKSFIYTTAPPPLLSAATNVSLDLVKNSEAERKHIFMLSNYLKNGLKQMSSFSVFGSAHIVSTLISGTHKSITLSQSLFDQGLFVQALRPPTVPVGLERLRWTITSLHTLEHVDQALHIYNKVINES